jgi:hypothetical protein
MSSPFNSSIFGFSFVEEMEVEKCKSFFPKYKPTPNEIKFGNEQIEFKQKSTLSFIFGGMMSGGLLSISLLRNKGRILKSLMTMTTTTVGIVSGTTYSILTSMENWVTYETDAEFSSIRKTYDINSGKKLANFSFLAESFRYGHMNYSPATAHLLKDKVLPLHVLEMVYKARYDKESPTNLVKLVDVKDKAAELKLIDHITKLAQADDDDIIS